MSKHGSDHYYFFWHARALLTRRQQCVIMCEVLDESLRKICRYQQNVPQHYYLLDTQFKINKDTTSKLLIVNRTAN